MMITIKRKEALHRTVKPMAAAICKIKNNFSEQSDPCYQIDKMLTRDLEWGCRKERKLLLLTSMSPIGCWSAVDGPPGRTADRCPVPV
jgi:hypothetical protein